MLKEIICIHNVYYICYYCITSYLVKFIIFATLILYVHCGGELEYVFHEAMNSSKTLDQYRMKQ